MKLKFPILALAAASIGSAFGQSFTSTSATGLWNSSRWNNSSDAAPYTSAWVANSNASFTSGTYSFSGANSSGSVNVGNITLASGVTVNFTGASGTIATSATRTIDVGSGALLDFNTQAMSTAAGTGFIKNGAGVLATAGGAYSGGFTLNAGTVIARGVDAMGANASNVLTLNGGVVASNANRSFTNAKFGGGIVIGGNVQFGELATVVSIASSTANLSFANNVSLGSAVRTFTQGNNGTQTFSGIVSNTSGGITFAANASTDGRFDFTNTANTFTGPINVNGGEVRFTADGSIGNAANDIVIDGGRFAKASDALTVTLGAGRDISVGDAVGTSISSPGTGVLIYNNVIANKTGETGSWSKQGGGTLELGGASTYSGSTAINNGIVKLTTGNDRLPTGTMVSIGQAASANLGTLDLNGRNQQISGLNSTSGTNATTGNNTVTSTAAATLTLGGSGTYSYGDGTNANSGVITGAISLVKNGNGTQTLGDTNTYTGTTTVEAGTLIVNGNISTSLTTIKSGGTLGGSGSVGGLSVEGGGTLAPGNSPGNSPGILNVGNTSLASLSTFGVEINGNTVGTQYDQLNVTGTVSLAGLLSVTMGFAPADNALFFILANDSNDAVSGTFSNAPVDGGIYKLGGQDFKISYFGDSVTNSFTGGNDVVLMAIPEPSATLLVGGLGFLLMLRRRR